MKAGGEVKVGRGRREMPRHSLMVFQSATASELLDGVPTSEDVHAPSRAIRNFTAHMIAWSTVLHASSLRELQ